MVANVPDVPATRVALREAKFRLYAELLRFPPGETMSDNDVQLFYHLALDPDIRERVAAAMKGGGG